jgi:hypothetical protein
MGGVRMKKYFLIFKGAAQRYRSPFAMDCNQLTNLLFRRLCLVMFPNHKTTDIAELVGKLPIRDIRLYRYDVVGTTVSGTNMELWWARSTASPDEGFYILCEEISSSGDSDGKLTIVATTDIVPTEQSMNWLRSKNNWKLWPKQ